jgi:hypothetical protein
MKPFTSYMEAAKFCVKRGIDLSRIVRQGLYNFTVTGVVRAS